MSIADRQRDVIWNDFEGVPQVIIYILGLAYAIYFILIYELQLLLL